MEKDKLISFDLDMTLLNHADMKIPDSALRAWEKLRENYILVLGSGRNMDNAYSVQYQELLKPDAIIHLNGTKITVGHELIYYHLFDEKLLLELLDYAMEKGYCLGASVDGIDYVTSPELVMEHDKQIWGKSDRKFKDPYTVPRGRVHTLWFFGNADGALEMSRKFPAVNAFPFSNYEGADIVETEASKAAGLKRLCAHYGIRLENTYAFGDSMNDVEIIRTAGTGIAMGNAIPEVKAAADYVTDDIDKDGIYKACLHLGLF